MPKVIFLPDGTSIDVDPNTKLLVAGTRAKVNIRFGCGACRCGTCGVKVKADGVLSAMEDDERALLTKIGLSTDGDVRLACRTRIQSGSCDVDLTFQDTYSPDENLSEEW